MECYSRDESNSFLPVQSGLSVVFLTDVLIFSSEIRPFFTASVMLLKLPPHSRSVPLKTASAEAWAASGCVSCFLRWKKSPIAPQSVTTIPLNPQSLRRIWVNRRLLPQQGIAFETVVSAHHFFNSCFLYQFLESRKVGFP